MTSVVSHTMDYTVRLMKHPPKIGLIKIFQDIYRLIAILIYQMTKRDILLTIC